MANLAIGDEFLSEYIGSKRPVSSYFWETKGWKSMKAYGETLGHSPLCGISCFLLHVFHLLSILFILIFNYFSLLDPCLLCRLTNTLAYPQRPWRSSKCLSPCRWRGNIKAVSCIGGTLVLCHMNPFVSCLVNSKNPTLRHELLKLHFKLKWCYLISLVSNCLASHLLVTIS